MEVDSEGQTGGGADQAQQVVSPSNDGRSASADYNDDGSNGYRGPKAACVACRSISECGRSFPMVCARGGTRRS